MPLINAIRMSASENSKVVEFEELPPDDILLQVTPGSGLVQNKEICNGWNTGRCIEPDQLNERDAVPEKYRYSLPESQMDLLIESYKMYPAHIYHKIESGNRMGEEYQLPICNGLNAPCQDVNDVFKKAEVDA